MANPLSPYLYGLAVNQPTDQRLLTVGGGEISTAPIPMQRGRQVTLAPVAGRALVHTNIANGALLPFMNQTYHWAKDNISAIQVAWPNWHCQGGLEAGTGGPVTITASVEYPLGSFTKLTFGGQGSLTIANLTTGFSDIVTLATPIPFGARFRIRCLWTPGAGSTLLPVINSAAYHLVTSGTPANNVGDAQEQTSTDKTLSGTVIDRGASTHTGPIAILGYTAKPSIAFLGDSRQVAVGENVADGNGDAGEYARIFGPGYGYVNLGCPSESTGGFLTPADSANRRVLAAFATLIACQYGINDVQAGVSVATLLANLTAIANLFPTIPFLFGTIPPSSTSTDGWLTLGNQTTNVNNANRVGINGLIRQAVFQAPNVIGFIELADQVESARDSGLWQIVPGVAGAYTTDGIHETSFANRQRAAPWPFMWFRQGF